MPEILKTAVSAAEDSCINEKAGAVFLFILQISPRPLVAGA
jgi:hypothetical protein